MITQWYEPEPGSAAHPTAIARSLQRRGHQVKVLTGYPNYPHGKVYDGYRQRLRTHETRDAVELLRIPLWPSHDANAIHRGLALTSFAASAATQAAWLRDVDVCLVYLSPATVGAAARILRRLAGVPYVLYVQDLWPDSVTASGFVGNERVRVLIERGVHRFLTGLYRHAEATVAIAPGMAALLRERGVPEGRDHVVYNWVDESIFAPGSPATETELDPGRTWIMYAGGIGSVQGLEAAVDAVGLLADRPEIGLAVVGDGVARPGLEAQAAALGLGDRVRFLGSRPMASIPALMSQAAAQLVSLTDRPLFRVTVPSKLQSAMACGQPVVCAVAGDASELTLQSGAGAVAVPGSASSIADAFLQVADATPAERSVFGANARAFYESELSESVGAARLEKLLADAAARRGVTA